MADQIDFSFSSYDTGEADADAYSPVRNGEDAEQATFNRPTRALQNRTEVLRAEANRVRWLRDADRAIVTYLTGGALSWDSGTGEVSLAGGAALNVLPLVTPGEARAAQSDWTGSGSLYVTRFAHATLDTLAPGNQILVVSQRYAHEGGNEITINIDDVAGTSGIVVDVSGDGTVTDPGVQPSKDDIRVTFDSTAGHTIADLITAVNSDPVAGALVQLTYAGSGSDTDPAYSILSAVQLSGGIDGVWHRISDTELAAFFAASADNALERGDTLAIWYDTVKARRQSHEAGNAHLVTGAELVNLSREPEKAANAIPLCKRVSNELVFPNGTIVASGSSATLLGPDAVRADLNRGIASPPGPGANSYGAEIVGVDTSGFTELTPATDDAQTVFEAIDADVADLETRVTANKDDIDRGGIGVQHLYDVYAGSAIGHVDEGYGFRCTPYPAPADTALKHLEEAWTTLDFGSGSPLQCTNGRAWFLYGASALIALDIKGLEESGPTLPDPTATGQELWKIDPYAGTVYDMDCNGEYLAVFVGNEVRVYDADTGAVVGSAWTVDNGSGNALNDAVTNAHVLVRRDRVWVFWSQQEAGAGDYVWYAQYRDIADVGLSGGAQRALKTDPTASAWGTQSVDATDDTVYAAMAAPGATDDVLVIDDGATTTSLTVTSASSGVPRSVCLTPRHIFLAGNTLLTTVDFTSGGGDMLRLARNNPGVDTKAREAFGFTSGATSYYTKIISDGRLLYALLYNSSETQAHEWQVLDANLNIIDQYTHDPAGNTTETLDICCDGQYLFEVRDDGKAYAWRINVNGGVFGFDPKGRAPMWTNHYLIGGEL